MNCYRHSLQRVMKAYRSRPLFNKEWCEWFANFLRANHTLALSLSKNKSFAWKKIVVSLCFHYVFDSFSLLFLILCPRGIRSRLFFKKSDESDLLLEKKESLFRSFAHIKRVIRLKNQGANSQPWKNPCGAHKIHKIRSQTDRTTIFKFLLFDGGSENAKPVHNIFEFSFDFAETLKFFWSSAVCLPPWSQTVHRRVRMENLAGFWLLFGDNQMKSFSLKSEPLSLKFFTQRCAWHHGVRIFEPNDRNSRRNWRRVQKYFRWVRIMKNRVRKSRDTLLLRTRIWLFLISCVYLSRGTVHSPD